MTTLYERLSEQYPENFANCYDFSIGEGWNDLVERLTHAVIRAQPGVKIDQVKEKFGTLRFYVDSFTEETNRLIEAAEIASESTCEVCGKSGTLRRRSWMVTLCDEHAGETK